MATLNSVVGALRANLTLNTAAFHKGAKSAQADMKGLISTFKSAGPALAATAKAIALAFTAAVGAVSTGTVLLANNAKEIQRSAKQLGMTADSYQVLTKASQRYGIEADKMKDILKDLNDRMGDYLQTGAGPLKDFMENVAKPQGVNVQDLMKLPPEDQLIKIQNLMESAGLSLAEQTFHWEAIASDATYLIPMLARGGAELDKIRNHLIATGQVLSDDVLKNLSKFSSNLSAVGGVLSGWGNLLVSGFSDELADISTRVLNFISQSEGIRNFFTGMGEAIGVTLSVISQTVDAVILKINQISEGNSRFSSTLQSIMTIGQYVFQALIPPAQILWEAMRVGWELLKNVANAFSVVADVALYALAAILPGVGDVTSSLHEGLVSAIRMAVDAFATVAEESRHAFEMAGAYAKGGVDAIRDAFSLLPSALGDLMIQATNSVLGAVETMVNGVISRINGALTSINGALSKFANTRGGKLAARFNEFLGIETVTSIDPIAPIETGQVPNPFAGSAAKVGEVVADSIDRHVKPVMDRRIQERILADAPNLNYGMPGSSNQITEPANTPNAPYLPPPAAGGGGGGKGKGGGGKGKLSDEAREAQREAKKEADAYKNLQDRLTEMREGFGKTALQKQILNEQIKIGSAAAPEAVAAMVTQIDQLQRWEDAMGEVRSTFTDSFAAIITGAQSAREVLSSVLSDMANRMAKTAANSFFDRFVMPALNSWIGGPSAGGGDALSAALAAAGAPVPGFANGVTNFAGGLAVVGERGRETVALPRGASVIPNHQTERMLSGSGQAPAIHVSVDEGLKVEFLNDAARQSAQISQANIREYSRNQMKSDLKKFQMDQRAHG